MEQKNDNEIAQSRIQEIRKRHAKIGGHLRNTLDEAVRIGELLTAQKTELKHGAWIPWISEHLPFSERLARDYMRFWNRREDLKSASLADLDLSGARKLLAESTVEVETVEVKTAEEIGEEVHGILKDAETLPEMILVLQDYRKKHLKLGRKFPVKDKRRLKCLQRNLCAQRFLGHVLRLWEKLSAWNKEMDCYFAMADKADEAEGDALRLRWDEIFERYEWLRGPVYQKKMRELEKKYEKQITEEIEEEIKNRRSRAGVF